MNTLFVLSVKVIFCIQTCKIQLVFIMECRLLYKEVCKPDIQNVFIDQFIKSVCQCSCLKPASQIKSIGSQICMNYVANAINICDCLNSHLDEDYVCSIISIHIRIPSVNFKHVKQQNNMLDCGVFAMFVTSIVIGNKQEYSTYDLKLTGIHLFSSSVQPLKSVLR